MMTRRQAREQAFILLFEKSFRPQEEGIADVYKRQGIQCFKLAGLACFPFGKEVQFGGGAGSVLLNILWMIFGGLLLAIESAILGCILCITIIGIPFGKQCFKLAKLALMPFGASVVSV